MDAHLHDAHGHASRGRAGWWRSPALWVFIGFALVGALYLLTAHPSHAWGYLPYVLLLCPFLHLFGHRGYGGRGP